MSSEDALAIYEDLGVKPVINAAGNMTLLGGSRVSPQVQEAMEVANRYFADMEELLKRSGEYIAGVFGAEAALVTPGCAAAMALSTAACMSGSDPEKMERLPDTSGMKNEILIQRRQRYKYDRCLTIFGGRLIEVGNDKGTTADQLKKAVTDKTALIHYFAPGEAEGVVPVEDVIQIGKSARVPILIDAASQIYPLDLLQKYTGMGADLVCYGAKYVGACNSTGILCGRKDLVDPAFQHCFVGFEASALRTIGRPLKVDRQEVIAVVVALREWLSMNHDHRIAEHDRKTRIIRDAIEDIQHITIAPLSDPRSLGNGLRITLDESSLGKKATDVICSLRDSSPSIWVRGSGAFFDVTVPNLIDGDAEIVASRLRELLTK